jgi:hypothetical protein
MYLLAFVHIWEPRATESSIGSVAPKPESGICYGLNVPSKVMVKFNGHRKWCWVLVPLRSVEVMRAPTHEHLNAIIARIISDRSLCSLACYCFPNRLFFPTTLSHVISSIVLWCGKKALTECSVLSFTSQPPEL